MIKLSEDDFGRLSSYVYQQCGINLTGSKRILLEGRLQKRLIALNMKSFLEYYKHVQGPKGQIELVHMLDSVSTNKTDFFRESNHFSFLKNQVLPEFEEQHPAGKLKVWSAACSSGEEPYTIAMTLQDYIEINHSKLDYEILGSDISTKVLQKAANAVYTKKQVADIPYGMRKRFLLKSKDPAKDLVRIAQKLRNKVTFRRINFMEQEYQLDALQDVIFCRNVLIYFDKQIQRTVVEKLLHYLKPGGYLLIGHSESLFNMGLPIKQLMPATFQKL